jgi:hypothetical protein
LIVSGHALVAAAQVFHELIGSGVDAHATLGHLQLGETLAMHVRSISDTVVIPLCAHLYGMIVHEWRALMTGHA